jgi:hypothetical protein
MTMQTTIHGKIHELDLRDIEFLDERGPACWRDVLDEEPELGADRRWDAAMERADTRIWVRPYAARFD